MLVVAIGVKFVATQTPIAPGPTILPTINPTVTPTPSPNPTELPGPSPIDFPAPFSQQGISVRVTPWGDMYRHEPDCKTDFSVELFSPNQNTCFTNNNFNIVFHAGAIFWIVEKAYYTSDLFSGDKMDNC